MGIFKIRHSFDFKLIIYELGILNIVHKYEQTIFNLPYHANKKLKFLIKPINFLKKALRKFFKIKTNIFHMKVLCLFDQQSDIPATWKFKSATCVAEKLKLAQVVSGGICIAVANNMFIIYLATCLLIIGYNFNNICRY